VHSIALDEPKSYITSLLNAAGQPSGTAAAATAQPGVASGSLSAEGAHSSAAAVPATVVPAPAPTAAVACGTFVTAAAANGAHAPHLGGASDGPPGEEYGSEEAECDSFSDGSLSSWGSMDERREADSDYYDTEEEEEALAGRQSMHQWPTAVHQIAVVASAAVPSAVVEVCQ